MPPLAIVGLSAGPKLFSTDATLVLLLSGMACSGRGSVRSVKSVNSDDSVLVTYGFQHIRHFSSPVWPAVRGGQLGQLSLLTQMTHSWSNTISNICDTGTSSLRYGLHAVNGSQLGQ